LSPHIHYMAKNNVDRYSLLLSRLRTAIIYVRASHNAISYSNILENFVLMTYVVHKVRSIKKWFNKSGVQRDSTYPNYGIDWTSLSAFTCMSFTRLCFISRQCMWSCKSSFLGHKWLKKGIYPSNRYIFAHYPNFKLHTNTITCVLLVYWSALVWRYDRKVFLLWTEHIRPVQTIQFGEEKTYCAPRIYLFIYLTQEILKCGLISCSLSRSGTVKTLHL